MTQPDRMTSNLPHMNTDLVIVGGGAAGLMAGVIAGELGISATVIERKHRPGRKLLMCGNNRCNITHDAAVADMLSAYGEPMESFLQPAFAELSPERLRAWFARNGLRTVAHDNGKVFPQSERADDVLHFFTDKLRDLRVPLTLNCAVGNIEPAADGIVVRCPALSVCARTVLIATGGVSYPKTGSVGDGQRFAKTLGHRVLPYRPGLVGFEVHQQWLTKHLDSVFPGTILRVRTNDRTVGTASGEIRCTPWGVRGPAVHDASRLIARQKATDYVFDVDLCPTITASELQLKLIRAFTESGDRTVAAVLGHTVLPRELARDFVRHELGLDPNIRAGTFVLDTLSRITEVLKRWSLRPTRPRPLKEAMVTVGGIDLANIDPGTMQSRLVPGLYFAGEVMDVDGPTGGYNLHAAFATANLAVHSVAHTLGQSRLLDRGRNPERPISARRRNRKR